MTMHAKVTALLAEDGSRWMTIEEQQSIWPYTPKDRNYYTDGAWPVWLFLSNYLRAKGYRFDNGLGVSGQMRNMREAVNR